MRFLELPLPYVFAGLAWNNTINNPLYSLTKLKTEIKCIVKTKISNALK